MNPNLSKPSCGNFAEQYLPILRQKERICLPDIKKFTIYLCFYRCFAYKIFHISGFTFFMKISPTIFRQMLLYLALYLKVSYPNLQMPQHCSQVFILIHPLWSLIYRFFLNSNTFGKFPQIIQII